MLGMMIGPGKKDITDGIIEGIVGGKKAYSTAPSEYPEAAKLCAQELLKAIEAKDPNKIIAAFIALSHEAESYEGEEESEEKSSML